jgi:DNA-binding beta-propeller fold protein YncE
VFDPVRRRVLFTDAYGRCVRAWYVDEKRAATIAGVPGKSGHVDGSCSTAQFSMPFGVAIDPVDGALLVADTVGSSRIVRVDEKADTVQTIAGDPKGETGLKDGIGTDALFQAPQTMACDSAGNCYVADTSNHRIRMCYRALVSGTRVWAVAIVAGDGRDSGQTDGPLATASLPSPKAIAIDPQNEAVLYVACSEENNIRIVDRKAGAWRWRPLQHCTALHAAVRSLFRGPSL